LIEAKHFGQFLNQVEPVKSIFRAETAKFLLKAAKNAYKTILEVKRVNFFFID